jgi:hypothetical protein
LTILTVIHLTLAAGTVVPLLWPIRRLHQAGYKRVARGHGLMAAGILLAQIGVVLPRFDMPPDHWTYWVLLCVGMAMLFLGLRLVVLDGRERGGYSERNADTR